MEFRSGDSGREHEIGNLFTSTFCASEGEDEGKRIGKLVLDLMNTTSDNDLIVWPAYDSTTIVGCIMISRLKFADDDRTAFILSPVAVKTDVQKTGVGQRLISHGLDDLAQRGVDLVVTYGDPHYYSRTGFKQITEDFAQAPLKLSFPEGWLGHTLSGAGQSPFKGRSQCVTALDHQEFW